MPQSNEVFDLESIGGRGQGVIAEEEEVECVHGRRIGRRRPSKAVARRSEGHVSKAPSIQLGLVILDHIYFVLLLSRLNIEMQAG